MTASTPCAGAPAGRSWALPIAAAALAVLVRVPFLLHGAAFFNSDEAIEGLMARHLGDLPVFFWGQGYKGVPEVYLAGAVFAIFGAGVVQLKAVTLAVWAGAVAATTRLSQRWHGNVAGATSGALLAVGTSSITYWSLSANAEIAWLTLLFATVLLAFQSSIERPDRPMRAWVAIGCGLAMWIHPLALAFLGGVALVAAQRSRWWRTRGWTGVRDLVVARDVHGPWKIVILAWHGLAALVAAVFLWTFLGFRVALGPISAAHPQKEFRLLVVIVGLGVVMHGVAGGVVAARRARRLVGWFACGLLPVVLFVLRGDGLPGALITIHHAADMPRLLQVFVQFSLPMFLAMRDLNGNWSGPLWQIAPLAIGVLVFLWSAGRACVRAGGRAAWRPADTIAIAAAALLVVMLFPGGAFTDVNSYRYLMPFFGLLIVSASAGMARVWSRSRVAGAVLVVSGLGAFAASDLRWFRSFGDDPAPAAIIRCLERHDVHAATADYWIAYRLTFLADEQVIVDREGGGLYPPYRAAVVAAVPRVVIRPVGLGGAGAVLCTSSAFDAVVESGR